jgi:hypothetical protein
MLSVMLQDPGSLRRPQPKSSGLAVDMLPVMLQDPRSLRRPQPPTGVFHPHRVPLPAKNGILLRPDYCLRLAAQVPDYCRALTHEGVPPPTSRAVHSPPSVGQIAAIARNHSLSDWGRAERRFRASRSGDASRCTKSAQTGRKCAVVLFSPDDDGSTEGDCVGVGAAAKLSQPGADMAAHVDEHVTGGQASSGLRLEQLLAAEKEMLAREGSKPAFAAAAGGVAAAAATASGGCSFAAAQLCPLVLEEAGSAEQRALAIGFLWFVHARSRWHDTEETFFAAVSCIDHSYDETAGLSVSAHYHTRALVALVLAAKYKHVRYCGSFVTDALDAAAQACSCSHAQQKLQCTRQDVLCAELQLVIGSSSSALCHSFMGGAATCVEYLQLYLESARCSVVGRAAAAADDDDDDDLAPTARFCRCALEVACVSAHAQEMRLGCTASALAAGLLHLVLAPSGLPSTLWTKEHSVQELREVRAISAGRARAVAPQQASLRCHVLVLEWPPQLSTCAGLRVHGGGWVSRLGSSSDACC